MRANLSQGQYVNGTWLPDVPQDSQQENEYEANLQSINPATGKPLWIGKYATHEVIKQAYQAAKAAKELWQHTPFEERILYIKKFVAIVLSNLPKLAIILAQETGQPLWEATASLKLLEDKLQLSIKAYNERSQNNTIQQGKQTLQCRYQPLGVVAILGAFNLPIHLSHGHLIPALIAGNTAILKPSELTPYINECILQCWHESGLPNGVLNMIQGNAKTAKILLEQPIDAVYFTGSYATGVAISEQFKHRPEVLLALEMGGNNPLIIEPVIDQNAAIYHTLVSAFITAGQRCSCTRRLILPSNAWGHSFLNQLIEQTLALKIDHYDAEPPPFLGPMIRRNHAKIAIQKQNTLINHGAEPKCLMQFLDEHSAFVSPGILDMQNSTMDLDEEIFAPLLKVYWYKNFSEAIEIANHTSYGLAAGLISDKTENYDYFLKHIRAGIISWNRPTTQASSQLPFGGIGRSGNHRPSAFFASDYCVYPVACMVESTLQLPDQPLPGIISK